MPLAHQQRQPLALNSILALQTRWLGGHTYLVHSTRSLILGHGEIDAVDSDLHGVRFDSRGPSSEYLTTPLLPLLGHHPTAGGSAQHRPPS